MAIVKDDEIYSIQTVYKASYDTSGELDLPAYSKTFNKVAETASVQQLYDYGTALMSLTIYKDAPYRVNLIDTSELVVD